MGGFTAAVFANKSRPNFYYILAPNIDKWSLPNQCPPLKTFCEAEHSVVYPNPENNNLDDWDNFYVVYIADCAFPPMLLINAHDEPDAIDIFADDCEIICKISEEDLKDYGDQYHLNSRGNPCDLEQIHIEQVQLVMAIRETEERKVDA